MVFTLAVALLAARAAAENKAVPAAEVPLRDTVIVYEAAEGCPSRGDFEARLRSRMPARESTATSPRRIEARLVRSGPRIAASVVLTDANGAATTRRIVAASCNEAVDALALIVALTVDPLEAHTGASPPDTTTSNDGAPAEGDIGDAAHGEPAPNASPQEPPKQPPAMQNRENPEPASPVVISDEVAKQSANAGPTASRGWRFGASTSFLVSSGVVPGMSPGGELAIAVSTSNAPALSVRLGGRLVGSASESGVEGNASFSWWSGFAAGCLGSDAAATLVLSGCAVYELGRLGASGSQTRNPSASATPWQALGPELRFEWAVAAPFALNVAAAGMFPLRATRFWLGDEVVFRVPWVGARAEIGVAARF